MFENLKQAQRVGMTNRERARLWLLLAMLLGLTAAFLSMRSCKTLPGRRDLPGPRDREEIERESRHIDRTRLRAESPDTSVGQARFSEAAIQYVRYELAKGLGDQPEVIAPGALAARPRDEALGGYYEVTGRITSLSGSDYRGDAERLWAMVLEGKDGGQVVAIRLGRATEPGQGAPTDAWLGAPTELKVGDLVIARGVYIQRRVGTIGGIGLSEPTPVLLAPEYRRIVEPQADVISSPREASLERIDDQFQTGTVGLDDPAIYQLLQWVREKGQAWFRERIDRGELQARDWTREAFDSWSAEVDVRTPGAARPFTQDARGRLYRTSGYAGRLLLEDWPAVRPNPWGVQQFHWLYLWSDYYGNRIVPCLSPFSYDTFQAGDWRPKDQRVYVYGLFVKNYTYDTQKLSAAGTEAQKLTMPLFLVVDVRPYPVGEANSSSPVAWVLGGVIGGLGLLFFFLMRSERRGEAAHRKRRLALQLARSPFPAPSPKAPPGEAPVPPAGSDAGAGPTAPP